MTDVLRSIRKRVMRARQHLVSRHTEPRRVIFFHIPKCAGISVSEHFGLCAGSLLSLREDLMPVGFDRQVARARHAPFVAGHFGWEVLEHIRGDALVFTVLRDPLARLRSQYWFHHERDRAGHPAVIAGRSFGKYLESAAEVDNVMARQLAVSTQHARSATLKPYALRGWALEHLATFDHVGFMATLDADLARMCVLAGYWPPPRAPWLNRSAPGALTSDELHKAQAVLAVDREVYAAAHAAAREPGRASEVARA
jgi:hypothetical protein